MLMSSSSRTLSSPSPVGSRSARAPLTAAAVAVVVASLPAQVPPGLQFAELGKRHLPEDADNAQAVAYGDVDGDGDLDLVVGNFDYTFGQQTRLYRNDGSGVFADATAGRMPVRSDSTTSVALGDVDGDGDLDLVVGNSHGAYSGQDRLYLNNGTGTFTDATAARMPVDNDSTRSVALGDVDGDGDLDLLVGNDLQQNRLYLNNGSGTFTDATAARMPVDSDSTTSLALNDFDGDGDLDLVIGNIGQSRLYQNNGTGTYSDVTAGRMPARGDFTNSVAAGDVDGDGDLDLALGNWGAPVGAQDRLYLNNGTGVFTDATATHLPAVASFTEAVALSDLDGDGDLDLVIGNGGVCNWGGCSETQSRIYVNNGSGIFADATATHLPAVPSFTTAIALGDVDGDGDGDLVCGNLLGQDHLYLNAGNGVFTDGNSTRMPLRRDITNAIAEGDVDGDGDLDVVVGNLGQSRLYRNDGTGAFTDATASAMPLANAYVTALALGDVDGDGDLDLVTGNETYFSGSQKRLYLNNGTGTFTDATATRMPVDNDSTTSVALGDVDRDGDLDLVIGNWNNGQNRLYLNNGAGAFGDATATRLPVVNDSTTAVLLGDVDGDGDLDLVVGNFYQQSRLYLNSGTGTFSDATATSMPVASDGTTSLALGDVDRDGDLDLVIGNGPNYFGVGQQNRLYLNNGAGAFTDATAGRMPVETDINLSLALGDVDQDGDLDLLVGNGNSYPWGRQDRLYLNDGTGTFTDATASRMPIDDENTRSVALGDMDGDGDLDFVCGNRGQSRVYFNLQRQLDAPYLLRPGQPYTLEVYSRYATPSVFDVALAYLSTTRLSIPIPPYGILGIDPMIPLPPVLIPPSAGVAATTFDVPNLPALAGIEVFAQAAIVPWPFDLRLTNVVADRVVR